MSVGDVGREEVVTKMIKSAAIKILTYLGIIIVIDIVWRLLEVAEFGQIQPSGSDNIICALFAYSVLRHIYPGGEES